MNPYAQNTYKFTRQQWERISQFLFLALALSHSKALGKSAQLPQALLWLHFAGILQELQRDHKQHCKIREIMVVAGITLEIKGR